MNPFIAVMGETFSYFCIGFTAVVLTSWLMGPVPNMEEALYIGLAIGCGRFVRLIMVDHGMTSTRETVDG